MTFYPTTLLPPSPLYSDSAVMISTLCDHSLKLADDNKTPPKEVDQYYKITMSLIDFWADELGMEIFS